MRVFLTLLLLLIAAPAPASDDTIPGPIPAEYVEAYDGDTATVRAHIWPGHIVVTDVRLAHVDTAEIRADCPREERLAEKARAMTRRMLGEAERIRLHAVRRGKYAGRVIARMTADGTDLGQALLDAGLGRPYDGGEQPDWCAPAREQTARE